MKITSKTLMLSLEHDIKVGNNDAIEATVIHQVFVYENKEGKVDIEMDFCDVTNVKFLGMSIEEGYQGYKKFKEQMKALGIDVDQLIDEAVEGLITDEDEEKLKSLYKAQVGN